MNLPPFLLERHFAKHEFTARRLLSSSDCESLSLAELLGWADDEVAARWRELRLSYTDSRGLPLLRRDISRLYSRVSEKEVLTVFPSEGIFLALQALVRPGDRIIVTWPGYQSLATVAETLGAEVVRWTAREEGGWHFDIDELHELAAPGLAGLIVNFPHNPTGALPSPTEFEAVVATAKRAGAWLFSDEMYRFLEHAPATTLPAAVSLYERAITLGGLSKSFSLPGLRMGWLASHDKELLNRIAELKDYTTICAGAVDELLAVIALRSRETILQRNRELIQANMLVTEAFVERTGLFSFSRPRGGSITLVRLKGGHAAAFCRHVVDEAGIMLVAAEHFQFGDEHIRLGLGRADLAQGLEELAVWLDR
jgi:aspartate/methionine/tyrosine aminotransferase